MRSGFETYYPFKWFQYNYMPITLIYYIVVIPLSIYLAYRADLWFDSHSNNSNMGTVAFEVAVNGFMGLIYFILFLIYIIVSAVVVFIPVRIANSIKQDFLKKKAGIQREY
jgi:hypothetical protein